MGTTRGARGRRLGRSVRGVICDVFTVDNMRAGSIVVGNGCSVLPDLTGQFVLLFASDACTFEDQVLNAQNANADGAILVAYENESLFQVCYISSHSHKISPFAG